MVITEIAEGLAGIKTALDILKGLKKSGASSAILSEIADLQSALIEVQQGIMAANQTHTSDIDRIRQLEDEVSRLKAWDGEKDRYELKVPAPGVTVYALRSDKQNGDPPHWLCVNCRDQGKKSILQAKGTGIGNSRWDCPECKFCLVVDVRAFPT